MSKTRILTRGAAAAATGCNIETLRFYEEIKLFPAPPRSAGGHRLYDEILVRRLKFIRGSRELGFSLDEIRGLLRLVDDHSHTCAEVKSKTLDHLDAIGNKIADLLIIQSTLKSMAARCEGGQVPECPIIDVLYSGGERN